MKIRPVLFVFALAAAAAANAVGVASNSLVVLQETGNTSAATPINLVNYSTSGTLLNTFSVPSTGATALTQSGSAGSEGALNLSADGTSLTFVGYRADAGTTSVVMTSSTANPRVIGSLNIATGVFDTSTTTSSFTSNNIRSGYVANGTYYAVGANTGLISGPVGSQGGQTVLNSGGTTNLRVVKGFGGNVYFSTGSGSTGIYQYTPGSGTGNQTQILNLGLSSSTPAPSPYDFEVLSSTSILVADSTAGIKLYTNGVATATLTPFGTTIAGSSSFALLGGSIFWTTSDGLNLETATFNGTMFGPASVLATTTSANPFRGVESIAPQAVPEPSAFAALGLGAFGLLRRRKKS